MGALIGNLTRGSHYNPGTDAATIFAHDDPVTEHELGHAIDFNELAGKGKIDPNWLKRQGKGSIRDLYHLLYGLPPASLWHEGQANIKSRKSLERSLAAEGDEPDLKSRLHRRQQVLPAGYGSYIGAAVDPLYLLGGTAPLIGMAGGKSYGLIRATRMLEQAKKLAPAEPELAKAADSATTRIQSYKGHDDQGFDMGARAVMEKGQPETPRPHKTTQGDISDGETDRFSKGADDRITAPEIVQPVPVTPSQSVLKAKKIAPASLPTLAETDGNRMRFGKPYRSTVKTFADKRSAMEKIAQGTFPKMTPPGSPTLLPPGSTGPGSSNQPTPGAGPQPQPQPRPPQGATPGAPDVPVPAPTNVPPQPTAGVPLPTLEQQGDPLMSRSAIPGTHPSLESPAAGPQGDSLMPKTEPPAGASPAKSWGGAWDALKGAWGKLPYMGKGILGGGGIALLLLLLSKLFGKRGDASYSEEEIERAGNLLDRMSQRQKMALWGEAQAQPDEIEKMACNMAKRYSRTHKVGKPPAKRGQFAAGNKFQGVKQAQGPGTTSLPQWAQQMKAPRQPTGTFGPSSALPKRVPAPAASLGHSIENWLLKQQPMPAPGQKPMPTVQQMMSQMRRMRSGNFGAEMAGKRDFVANPDPTLSRPSSSQRAQAPSSPGQFGAAAGVGTQPAARGPKITRTTSSEPGPTMRMTVPRPPMKPADKIVPPTVPSSGLPPLQLPGQQKRSTWVTRNGKRVHIKHKKKRKKSAAEFGKVAAQPGLPGAAAGGAGGLDLAMLLKLLLAKANTPSIQDTPGTGIFEPTLVNAGLGGGPSARQQSSEDMLAELQAKSAADFGVKSAGDMPAFTC